MEQVKKSDTWLRARTGFVRAHLLLLWAEAWEQTPCGSLPDDDELLALLLDMDPIDFEKHRAVLLRGWWLAEDGRLYHDVIVERVQAMLVKRMSDAQRSANYRGRQAASLATPPVPAGDSPKTHTTVTRDEHATHAPVGGEFNTKHQNQKEEIQPPTPLQGEPKSKVKPDAGGGFARFWAAWPKHPRKVARHQCWAKWRSKKLEDLADRIVAHVEAMKQSDAWRKDGGEFIPAPLVYLNQDRWEGELLAPAAAAAHDDAERTAEYLRSQVRTPEQKAASLAAARALLASRGKKVTA